MLDPASFNKLAGSNNYLNHFSRGSTGDKQGTRGTKQLFWGAGLVQQETFKITVVQTVFEPARFNKRAGSKH